MKKKWMELALTLAEKGRGWTKTNPMVGAVIVKDRSVIGQGYHETYGGLHAEREAIKDAKDKGHQLQGATLYVTLEPCCHHGKTSPCTEAIIEAGFAKVIIASLDPNPLVGGKGVKQLKDAGIEVSVGLLEEESQDLNRHFHYFHNNQKPYVTLKYAMTLDGRIAAYTGDSKWVTGPESRRQVHLDRHYYQAILVGIGTVTADDPMLTTRLKEGNGLNPVRVICNSHLNINPESKIVQTADQVPSVIATLSQDQGKIKSLEDRGCQVWQMKEKDGRIDLGDLIDRLGENGIQSLYVEGGSQILGSFIEYGNIQEIHTYIGTKLVGGYGEFSPVSGFGFEKMNQALDCQPKIIKQIGEDIYIESRVKPCLQE